MHELRHSSAPLFSLVRGLLLLLGTLAFLATTAVVSALVLAGPAGAQDNADTAPGPGPQQEQEPEATAPDITFPAVGPVTYTDTWGACRGAGCSRSHKGVDIFGHRLTPLVAANDGVVTFVRRSATGTAGNTIIITDDAGWRYLYLHLNNDSPGTDDGANPQAWIVPNGLRVGDRVKAGDVVGYLGDSGNAETTPAHLHFELHQPGVGAINPTPSVRAADSAGRRVTTAQLASSVEGRAEHEPLIEAWYRALLRREPTTMELFAWADRFDIGFADRNTLIADLTMAPERRDPAGAVLRAYQVALDRRPDLNELRFWLSRLEEGTDTEAMLAELFASTEFEQTYDHPDDAAVIEIIYRNARGRPPSDSVRTYWTDQLAGGRARASMAAYFVGSYGLKDATWHELEVQQAFRAALDRLPTPDEHNHWVTHLDAGGLIIDVVDGIRPEDS